MEEDIDLGLIILAEFKILSMVMIPLCLIFLTFFQGPDNQCCCRGIHINLSSTILKVDDAGVEPRGLRISEIKIPILITIQLNCGIDARGKQECKKIMKM